MSYRTDEDDAFLATVTAFATREIEPMAETIERDGRIPDDLTDRLSALDLLTVGVPADRGGCGAGVHTTLGCFAAVGSTSPAVALLLVAAHAAAAAVEPSSWDPGQAVLGEPVAIVDARELSATAAPGAKARISGTAARVEHVAQVALLVVVVSSGSGEGVYLVPRDAPGVALGPSLGTTGLRGADAQPVVFDAVLAPFRIGGADQIGALRRWQAMGIAAVAAGVARRALTEAEIYAGERRQFGRAIAEFPAMRAILDGCDDLVVAVESELAALGQSASSGTLSLRRAVRGARRATRAAVALCLDAVQVHGGYGYVAGAPVERLLRDVVSLRAISSGLFLRAESV